MNAGSICLASTRAPFVLGAVWMAAAALTGAACRATTAVEGGPGAGAAIGDEAPGSDVDTDRSGGVEPPLLADVAPVTALAYTPPTPGHPSAALWVGSARGLRRIDLSARRGEWLGRLTGFNDREVTALAADRDGTIWVGSESGVGVFTPSPSPSPEALPLYRALAQVHGLTHILAMTNTPEGDDAWLGTEDGLYRLSRGVVTPVALARGDVVTSLDRDTDGQSVWVGLRQRGVLRVDATLLAQSAPTASLAASSSAVGAGFPGALDFVNPLGTTVLANGTRVAIGHARDGSARLVVLDASGPVLMSAAQVPFAVQSVVRGCGSPALVVVSPSSASAPGASSRDDGGASTPPSCDDMGQLVAGAPQRPSRFRLSLVPRGELVASGAVRFAPTASRKSLDGPRLLAVPIAPVGLEAVTVALAGGPDGLFIGTRSSGTALLPGPSERAEAPVVLPSGEVALGATRVSVACPLAQHCFIATGTGTGWVWHDGARQVEALPPTAVGGRLMTLASREGDADSARGGPIFSIAGDPGKVLRIGRLAADGTRFEPVGQIPVATERAVIATAATVSPRGDLWIAIRERAADGSEAGRGVLEVQLPALRVVHHRPYTAKEAAPADVIPISGDVRAIRFRARTAELPQSIWFCTTLGVFRFQEGELARWGENNGLGNERCEDLLLTRAGSVWAATAAGPARFDGKAWRAPSLWPTDSDGRQRVARALVELGDDTWAGTADGLWSRGAAPDPERRPWTHALGVLDDDVRGLATDRFDRLWVLGRSGVTPIDPRRLATRAASAGAASTAGSTGDLSAEAK